MWRNPKRRQPNAASVKKWKFLYNQKGKRSGIEEVEKENVMSSEKVKRKTKLPYRKHGAKPGNVKEFAKPRRLKAISRQVSQ